MKGQITINKGRNNHGGCGFEEIRREVIHYPSLKTVLMVEETIEEKGEFKNKRRLWKALPKKIMYQTLLVILDYLEVSHKILIGEDGIITWIWDPEYIDKILKRGVKIR